MRSNKDEFYYINVKNLSGTIATLSTSLSFQEFIEIVFSPIAFLLVSFLNTQLARRGSVRAYVDVIVLFVEQIAVNGNSSLGTQT